MKGYVCGICGFIAIDGQAPEKCPVCGAPRKAFAEKEDAIHTPGSVTNYTEPEKKHIPVITINKACGIISGGCNDVDIKVGEMTHPMLPEHFITRIDCYLDKKYIARIMITTGALNPAAGLHLKADKGTFTAIETCNVHGSWIAEIGL